MKYTIELTDTEYNILTGFMNMINSEIQTYYFQETELKPIKIRTTNVEDTKEYQIGYKAGYDMAQSNAQATKEEWGKIEYNRGLEECETAIDRLMDFTVAELEKEFGAKVITDVWLENSIQDIIAITKAYEEKKKAEEEIKVGDEVKDLGSGNIGVVMSIGKLIVYITNNGVYTNTLGSLEKTGRHFEEVEQLLSKLKERDNEQ